MDRKTKNSDSKRPESEPIDWEHEILTATKLVYKKDYHYPCEICGYKGVTKQQRYKHMKTTD